jgi:hypothetical protein
VRLEGVKDRFTTERVSPPDDLFEDRLVTAVHAIEIPDGQNRAPESTSEF